MKKTKKEKRRNLSPAQLAQQDRWVLEGAVSSLTRLATQLKSEPLLLAARALHKSFLDKIDDLLDNTNHYEK